MTLLGGRLAGPLADADKIGPGARMAKDRARGKVVEKDDVGGLKTAQAACADEVGRTRSGTDQVDDTAKHGQIVLEG